jgi:hypothetical protein
MRTRARIDVQYAAVIDGCRHAAFIWLTRSSAAQGHSF